MKILRNMMILIAVAASFEAAACKCDPAGTVEKGFEVADVVMTGTVLSSETVTFSYPEHTSSGMHTFMHYRLLVTGVYKGSIKADTVSVYTGTGTGDCGYPFKTDKRYIVYGYHTKDARKENSPFPQGAHIVWTNTCTRTTLFERVEKEAIEKIAAKKIVK